MVEKDTVAGKHLVCLSIVDGDPVTIQLGCTWGGRRGGGEEGRGGKEERRGGEQEWRGVEGSGVEEIPKTMCVPISVCAVHMHSEQETRIVSCVMNLCAAVNRQV